MIVLKILLFAALWVIGMFLQDFVHTKMSEIYRMGYGPAPLMKRPPDSDRDRR